MALIYSENLYSIILCKDTVLAWKARLCNHSIKC